MKRLFFILFTTACSIAVQADKVVKVNFCAENAISNTLGWNNFTNATRDGAKGLALKDANGKYTRMFLSLRMPFNGTNAEGEQTSSTPLNMTKQESSSAFWAQAQGTNAKPCASFVLRGLHSDATYDFTFFASRKEQFDNRETQFTCKGSNTRSTTLNASHNTKKVATLKDMKPTADGTLELILSPGAHNNNWLRYYYLNALQIVEHYDGEDPEEKALRILTIGNSFSEDAVEQNLYELAAEAGVNLIIGNAYRGGQGFESHWRDVTQQDNTFEFRKVVDGVRTNTTQQALSTIITNEPWDYISFQQVSQESGLPQTFEPYLDSLLHYTMRLATCDTVRYGYHQTWAYAQNSTHSGFVNYDKDQMKMYTSICQAVKEARANHPELQFVIPSGTAIQNARTSFLSDNMNRDGYHLDYTIGRYTAACTWLEGLLGISPVGLTYRPNGVDSLTAAVLQEAAHAAVQFPDSIIDFHGLGGYQEANTIIPNAVCINFGGVESADPKWNDVTPVRKILTNLRDCQGEPTEIIIMLDDAFNGTNDSGFDSTITEMDMPDDVSKSCFWGYSQYNFDNKKPQESGGFTLRHLNPELTYDFELFASRANCNDNRQTTFRIRGNYTRIVSVNAANNRSETVLAQGIRPTPEGTITITVSPSKENNSLHHFYYINALRIMPSTSTSIELMEDDIEETVENKEGIYTPSGTRVPELQKGINIVDGQKVMIF